MYLYIYAIVVSSKTILKLALNKLIVLLNHHIGSPDSFFLSLDYSVNVIVSILDILLHFLDVHLYIAFI